MCTANDETLMLDKRATDGVKNWHRMDDCDALPDPISKVQYRTIWEPSVILPSRKGEYKLNGRYLLTA